MKRFTIISILSVFLLFNSGCDDYLDVNKNIDAPDYVEDYLYLSGVLQTYGDIYSDLLAVAPLTQMWSTSSSTYGSGSYADHYNPRSTDSGALIWRTVYFNHGMNLENMINQATAAQHWTLVGIGYAIKAYSWDMLTKVYGEAPMKQAFTSGRTSYDYDYQDEILTQARAWALLAIENLEKADNTVYASKISANDWVYGGDKAKWIKFAYAVLVRNLASLSNKTNFTTEYADKLIEYAGKSFQSSADDAMVKVAGGSQSVPYAAYNNFYGTERGNLGVTYFQHDYAVQVMTGTVPVYGPDGQRVDRAMPINPGASASADAKLQYLKDSLFYAQYPWEMMDKQIVCSTWKNWQWHKDTKVELSADKKTVTWTVNKDLNPGNYDPRIIAKLSTTDDPNYNAIDNAYAEEINRYFGGRNSTSRTGAGPSAPTVPHFYGRVETVKNGTTTAPNDGKGRYLFHDEAPYILTTCAEIKFCLAEAYWKKGQKDLAYAAFKDGVKADLDFTEGQLRVGTKGAATGGDKITKTAFRQLANEYIAGPFVEGLGSANLTLSHIMMQKWVALWTWGGLEAWVDLRKYHYDIDYKGEYPTKTDGWDASGWITEKEDTRSDKVYKGFYLGAARNIEFRNTLFNSYNEGSPMYRIRPRYNSEYVWNLAKLDELKPIKGTAENYHCSIPWFAYPGNYPTK